MDVGGTYVVVQQIFCKFLGHALGEGGDQYAFTTMTTSQNLVHQVVNLILAGAYLNLWVEQSCRTDNLFNHYAFGLIQFVIGWGSAHVDHLIHFLLEFLELQRSVVEGGGQTETVFYQVLLATAVTSIHGSNLWHTYVTFVDKQQIVVREEIQQAVWALTCLATIEITTIVLDA